MTAQSRRDAALVAYRKAEALPKGKPWRWVKVMTTRQAYRLAERALAKSREVRW